MAGTLAGKLTQERLVDTLRRYLTLTGSRRFLNRENADWDFVADGREDAWRDWLRKQGFTRKFSQYNGYPMCNDTQEIWVKTFPPTDFFAGDENRVEVVFSRNYRAKRRVIEWLEKHPSIIERYYQTDKKHRHRIWQLLQQQAEEGHI